jgi:hypothetical protein
MRRSRPKIVRSVSVRPAPISRRRQDPALAQGQAHGSGLSPTGDIIEHQDRFAVTVRHSRIDVADLAADHQTDDPVQGCRIHCARPDAFAVAQDRVPVANALAFFEEMADVNDADAALLQLADDPEKILRIHLGEAAGGLIHDQDLGIAQERPGDLHDLLFGDGQPIDRRIERMVS